MKTTQGIQLFIKGFFIVWFILWIIGLGLGMFAIVVTVKGCNKVQQQGLEKTLNDVWKGPTNVISTVEEKD